ncbi:hypothetical protein [Sphingobacterium hungaricum]
MHKAVIKFKNKKTLKVLSALSDYLGFTILDSKEMEDAEVYHIEGVPIQKGDPQVDIEELNNIFTKENMDAKSIRESAWKRRK